MVRAREAALNRSERDCSQLGPTPSMLQPATPGLTALCAGAHHLTAIDGATGRLHVWRAARAHAGPDNEAGVPAVPPVICAKGRVRR